MKKNNVMFTAIILAISLLFCAFSASAAMTLPEADPNNEYKYEEQIFAKLYNSGQYEDPYFTLQYYREGYEYYSDENTSTDDQAVPDYVVIYLAENLEGAMPVAYLFDDYLLYQYSMEFPFDFGIGIFVPKTGEVYDLVEAYEMGIDGIEKVFTETNIGRLLGDMDKDRKLTVKDATYIQKIHAGIEGFSDVEIYAGEFDETLPCAISDFNRDRATNIKDATAIQKYIAGITGDADEPEPAPFSSNIHQGAEYMDDCILVVVKKGLGHDYTLENFPEYEFSAIEKIGGTDGKGYAIYVLYLENPGKENVVEAIKALDYRAETDLYAAEPDYIYYVWH